MRTAYLIPAYQAALSLGKVIRGVARLDQGADILVIDDGSTDATADVARAAGASVIRHAKNLGKGAALRTGLRELATRGFDAVVSLDADGQHPADEAVALARHPAPPDALVLGVRDLERDGAPKANRFSNRFSNAWVSWFSGEQLADTQCGLRRYPIAATLALGGSARGFGFESEVLVRAARRRLPIVQVPVRVVYPPGKLRVSHFHAVKDPARIVLRLLYTAATTRRAP